MNSARKLNNTVLPEKFAEKLDKILKLIYPHTLLTNHISAFLEPQSKI